MEALTAILVIFASILMLFLVAIIVTVGVDYVKNKKLERFKKDHTELVNRLDIYNELVTKRSSAIEDTAYKKLWSELQTLRHKIPYASNSERDEYSKRIDSLQKEQNEMYDSLCGSIDKEINTARKAYNRELQKLSHDDQQYVYINLWKRE